MRSIPSYIVSLIAICLVMVSCKETRKLDWNPTMHDYTVPPFDMGRFINLCYYNHDIAENVNRKVRLVSTEAEYESNDYYDIINDADLAFVSADTLWIRSRYLNYRIQKGNNTLIVAQNIIPIVGGYIYDYDEDEEENDKEEIYEEDKEEFYENYEEETDNDAYKSSYEDTSEERVGQPVKSISGELFSLESFLSQASKQDFPLSDISTYPARPKIQMPGIFCSRRLSRATLLQELGVAYSPRYTEVMMASDRHTIAVRYTFGSGAHLSVLVNPLLLSNYAVSYENAQFAHVAMDFMRFAFTKKVHPDNYLSEICFHLELHSFNPLPENTYISDHDPTKKQGRAISSTTTNNNTGSKDSRDSLFSKLWPLLLLFLPLLLSRRQREIPIFEGYRNRSAEYAKHVGTMYANEGNLRQILNNRISYFYYHIKSKYGIDLSEPDRLYDSSSILASHWNMDVNEVRAFLSRLNNIRISTQEQGVITEAYLSTVCEQMNKYSNL